MSIRVKKGDVLVMGGRHFEIVSRLPSGEIQFEALDSGELRNFADEAVADLIGKGKAVYKSSSDNLLSKPRGPLTDVRFDDLPEEVKIEARRRFEYVTSTRDREYLGLSRADIKAILAAKASMLGDSNPPSLATYYRWRQRAGEPPRVSRLADVHRDKGNRKPRLSVEVRGIIANKINEMVMRPEPFTVAEVLSAVRNAIDDINRTRNDGDKLKKPGKSAVYEACNALCRFEVLTAQKGLTYAKRRLAAVGKGPTARAPLEAVEIDHTKIDLFIVDSKSGLPLGRPWLTILLDRYSKMVIGFYMGFEPPSYHSVGQALKHAVLPKTYVKERYPEIQNEWPCFGPPVELITDRGLEFIGNDLADAANEIGTTVINLPTKSPHMKGAVERYFGSLNKRLLHQQKGTTFSNIVERDEYDPMANAVITFDELLMMFHHWVIDVYAQEFHRGINDVPQAKWNRGCAEHPLPILDDATKLEALVGRVEYRTLSRKGIALKNLRYCSKEAVSWLWQGFAHHSRRQHRVKVKYAPSDLGQIWIQHPKKLVWLEVPAVDSEYASGLSEWQHKVIWQQAMQEAKGNVDLVKLDEAKERIRRMARDLMTTASTKAKVTTKERLARFNRVGSDQIESVLAPPQVKQRRKLPLAANQPETGDDKANELPDLAEIDKPMPSDDFDFYADSDGNNNNE